ncbi:MAG TPA: FliI/YscN family ATPase, partial [Gemmataceae bacterium]|nr:FliI/YscN family ATPase [Gemmataceae bacterium]
LVPYEQGEELSPGMTVLRRGRGLSVPVGEGLLGRIVDGLGRPIDDRGPLYGCEPRPVSQEAPAAMQRARIRQPFVTGQRALDGLLTIGRGQRVGIFAGSGVGKSTLLGEIAKGAESDRNVIALVGERGREVAPFLEDCLGPAGLARSVVVVATSDQTPLMRLRAAETAVTLADYYRRQGLNVLFMLDSLTRLAMARRELGLGLGEPPTARGYTPSVFQMLANTVERLGNAGRGSVTGILTVLVDGGDLDEPISDAARGLLDGHLVLDRRLANRGRFPAIHIAQSLSRVAGDVTTPEHRQAARKVKAALATYGEMEDLIRVGAYARGSAPAVDRALELLPAIEAFLCQEVGERTSFDDTRAALEKLAAAWTF